MKQKESIVAKTAGIVKTTVALSARQLRAQAEQSIALDNVPKIDDAAENSHNLRRSDIKHRTQKIKNDIS